MGKNRFLRWPGRLRHGRRMEDFELMSTKPLPKKWFPETYFHNFDDSPVVRNETFLCWSLLFVVCFIRMSSQAYTGYHGAMHACVSYACLARQTSSHRLALERIHGLQSACARFAGWKSCWFFPCVILTLRKILFRDLIAREPCFLHIKIFIIKYLYIT